MHTPFITSPTSIAEVEQQLEAALPLSSPVVSDFKVSAMACSNAQQFLGVNLEWAGLGHAHTVHAEQFALALARQHGASGINALSVTQWPCGHCRQFLLELGNANTLTITHTPTNATNTLSQLLPHAFELAEHKPSFWISHQTLEQMHALRHRYAPLSEIAQAAAMMSYSPYTHTKSGVAVATVAGQLFWGSLIENAAFNPSLPPLQAALCQWWAATQGKDPVRQVFLAQSTQNKLCYAEQSNSLAQVLGALEFEHKPF